MQPNNPKTQFVIDMGQLEGEPQNSTAEVAAALDRPEDMIGDDGYTNDIWAGAIHPQNGWIAWVEHREKQLETGWYDVNYSLKAIVDGRLAINWKVETYNPFFGCYVGYMAWHGDIVVMGYAEKHDNYLYAASIHGDVQRVNIGSLGSEWCVINDVLFYRPIETREAAVRRLKLPDLTELPALTEKQALAEGIVYL